MLSSTSISFGFCVIITAHYYLSTTTTTTTTTTAFLIPTISAGSRRCSIVQSQTHCNHLVPLSKHLWESPSVVAGIRSRMMTTDSTTNGMLDQCTELPDSLQDAAIRAAEATMLLWEQQQGDSIRCRIDFDTSIGDETFPLLKTSTEFMQQLVTSLTYGVVPGIQQLRQDQIQRVAEARAELNAMERKQSNSNSSSNQVDPTTTTTTREDELIQIIAQDGRIRSDSSSTDGSSMQWDGPITRIYFPDEGSAALARRDWKNQVPDCVEFSACGGNGMNRNNCNVTNDALVFFFCPRAPEAETVEQILQQYEIGTPTMEETTSTTSTSPANTVPLIVFVNPRLVDMGTTGFGLAGRMLRERLLDRLVCTYYLRTLPWGALTRQWPRSYSVWQEDANMEGGYRLIQTLDRLPSNPEVEDIYDIENGLVEERQSGGILDQLGDFVNGMMRL